MQIPLEGGRYKLPMQMLFVLILLSMRKFC
nr:MAG TPA: hypothetical protein [Caudoviricetes sp.]